MADGVVDEVVYYGDMTYYDVRVDGVAQPLTISMKNLIGRPVLEVGARDPHRLGRALAGGAGRLTIDEGTPYISGGIGHKVE